MFDGLPDPQAIATGLQRAAVHWAKAGYELAAGVGALIDEIVNGDAGDDEADNDRPTRIPVE